MQVRSNKSFEGPISDPSSPSETTAQSRGCADIELPRGREILEPN